MNLAACIHSFIDRVRVGEVEIYNEFSLQHELGIHLREALAGCKVQFERNVSHFGLSRTDFVKREIDISVTSKTGDRLAAIELKYPRNGQVPEAMYGFCKDISFLEQLRSAGFRSAYFLAFADDKLFYTGAHDGIYGYFRGRLPLTGLIAKPTGAKDTTVQILGSYRAEWKVVVGDTQFCLLPVGPSASA
jgi:hypothetical protein